MQLNSKKERPFLGSAINDKRQIRYSSVSQIKQFDPLAEGGCNRKWAFSYRFKIKLARTDALKEGSKEAELLEHYLRTGEDVLSPTLAPTKKYWPTPGDDLELEEPLGKIATAVELRDMLLKGKHPPNIAASLQEEIERHAGLTFAGIPIDGAADCRHVRGEYVDSDGILKKDPSGLFVVHVDDLKTTSRIYPQKVQSGPNAGTIIPAFTKTDAEVCEDVQMLGYARHAINKYKNMTHARLSLIYANKTKREAVKRTGLISVETILERTRRIDDVVQKMMQVATADKIEDIEPNVASCDSFNHVDPTDPKKNLKGCGYRYQCPLHISQLVSNMLGPYKESTMSLCDSVPVPGAAPSAAPAVPTPVVPAAPPLDPTQHAAAVEAERARLLAGLATGQPITQAASAPTAPQAPVIPQVAASLGFCPKCGTPLSIENTSKLPSGVIVHAPCPANVQAAPPVAPSLPSVAAPVVAAPPPIPQQSLISVNPPDQPRGATLVEAAAPPPAAEIAQVTDPELKAKLEQHARDHAQRAAAEAARIEAEKVAAGTSVWCTGGNISIEVTGEMAVQGGHTCACTKTFKGKPFKEGLKKVDGKHYFDVPKHKPKNKETAQATTTVATQAAQPYPLTQQALTMAAQVGAEDPSLRTGATPPPIPAAAPQAMVVPQIPQHASPPIPPSTSQTTHEWLDDPAVGGFANGPIPAQTNGHTNGHHAVAAPNPQHAFIVEMSSGTKFAIIAESLMLAMQMVAGRIEGDVKGITKLDGYLA